MAEQPFDGLAFAQAMTQVADVMRQLLETTTGYREECLRAGYSETAAEVMAMDAHKYLLGLITGKS